MNSKQEKDIRIEEVYNTLSSITKDLSGIYDKLQEVSSKYFAILNDNNLLCLIARILQKKLLKLILN